MAKTGSNVAVWAALAGNVLVAATKFAAAAVTGSAAMLSEAVHSLVDTVNELLLLYGIAPSSDFSRNFPFHPVLSLKARVLLVRKLPKGTDISYSRTYQLQNDAVIATIGIGYGDGYPRRLSNIGKVILPDGSLAPIRGRICMDQLCVEVADGCLVVPGDIVTLIGEHRGSEISVTEITNVIDATPHEITTCLTNRVPRVAV